MPYTEDEDFYDPDAPMPDLSQRSNAIVLCMDCAEDEHRYEVVSESIGNGAYEFDCDNCRKTIKVGDNYCDAIPKSN